VTSSIQWALDLPLPLLWLILFFSSGIEYVFPPFPGDAVVLAGGVISGSHIWGFLPVIVAVTAGSVAGAAIDFQLGVWLARPGDGWIHRWFARPRVQNAVGRIVTGFKAHGDLYLLINRFLPGLRAPFFVAAGYAGLRRTRTLLLATAGALIWNAMVLIVGLTIGANLEALLAYSEKYAKFSWIIVLVIGVVVLFRVQRRARKKTANLPAGLGPDITDPTVGDGH
jgi:membrane protein DedA with SNARE-associated domain